MIIERENMNNIVNKLEIELNQLKENEKEYKENKKLMEENKWSINDKITLLEQDKQTFITENNRLLQLLESKENYIQQLIQLQLHNYETTSITTISSESSSNSSQDEGEEDHTMFEINNNNNNTNTNIDVNNNNVNETLSTKSSNQRNKNRRRKSKLKQAKSLILNYKEIIQQLQHQIEYTESREQDVHKELIKAQEEVRKGLLTQEIEEIKIEFYKLKTQFNEVTHKELIQEHEKQIQQLTTNWNLKQAELESEISQLKVRNINFFYLSSNLNKNLYRHN